MPLAPVRKPSVGHIPCRVYPDCGHSPLGVTRGQGLVTSPSVGNDSGNSDCPKHHRVLVVG